MDDDHAAARKGACDEGEGVRSPGSGQDLGWLQMVATGQRVPGGAGVGVGLPAAGVTGEFGQQPSRRRVHVDREVDQARAGLGVPVMSQIGCRRRAKPGRGAPGGDRVAEARSGLREALRQMWVPGPVNMLIRGQQLGADYSFGLRSVDQPGSGLRHGPRGGTRGGAVKLVGTHQFAGPGDHRIGPGGQGSVTEGEPGGELRVQRQDASHVDAIKAAAQVEQAGAFGDGGQPGPDCCADLGQQGPVRGQLLGVDLREAAAEVKAAGTFRQRRVGQRIELGHLAARRQQQFGGLRIAERERPTARDGDAGLPGHPGHFGFGTPTLPGQRPGAACDGQHRLQVDVRRDQRGSCVDHLSGLVSFGGRYQAEMPGRHQQVTVTRHRAQHW